MSRPREDEIEDIISVGKESMEGLLLVVRCEPGEETGNQDHRKGIYTGS